MNLILSAFIYRGEYEMQVCKPTICKCETDDNTPNRIKDGCSIHRYEHMNLLVC